MSSLIGTASLSAGILLACATGALAQGRGQENLKAVQIGKEKIFPLGVTWVAQSLNGKPIVSARERPNIFLDDQLRARGFGGCNSFSVTAYPLKSQRVAVGPFALTRKQCDKQAMDVERSFLVALRVANAWDMEGANVLILKGQAGTLRFERGL